MKAATEIGLEDYVNRFFRYSGDIIIFDKPDTDYVKNTFDMSLLEAYEVIGHAVQTHRSESNRIEKILDLKEYTPEV